MHREPTTDPAIRIPTGSRIHSLRPLELERAAARREAQLARFGAAVKRAAVATLLLGGSAFVGALISSGITGCCR